MVSECFRDVHYVSIANWGWLARNFTHQLQFLHPSTSLFKSRWIMSITISSYQSATMRTKESRICTVYHLNFPSVWNWAQKKPTKKTDLFRGSKTWHPNGGYLGTIYLLLTDRQGANHAETPPVIPVQVRALGISVVEKDLSVSPAVDVCHALKGVFPCFNVQLTKNTCAK